jgi:acyl-CoA dehydrogenase
MIDFGLADEVSRSQKKIRELVAHTIRKVARYYDEYEREHEDVKGLEEVSRELEALSSQHRSGIAAVVLREEMSWGDTGIIRAISRTGLGNAAIAAVGTPEQKARFGNRYAAMAITEPGCGSDSAAIATTAKLDPETREWILNGEKIFVTGGRGCEIVVIWATLDRRRGRPAIKSFVVEKGTPGMTVTKLEKKLGYRPTDTAVVVFDDCRIPYDNILGSPEIKEHTGFQGAMKTFDLTRPIVAALAIGVARATLDFTKSELEKEGYQFPYDCGQHRLSAIQKTVLEMEAHLDAARLLAWRAAAMLDAGERNSLEASMAKAKAGKAATFVCQKCVEILGPLGYSREWLVEKWMRDCRVTDIYEGTGQIQMLIIARNILGFNREQLK